MECSCCWVCPDYPWFVLVYLSYSILLFHAHFAFNHRYTLVSLCSENGFEEGLSTLGLVSGLFGAMWSVGAFAGPTLGGILYEKIGFEWAAALQGLWALTSGLLMGVFYLVEHSRRRRRSKLENVLSTQEERTALLPGET